MASTFLNISTDTTLGGNSPSDEVVSSQKAIKTKIDTKQDTLVSGTNIKTVGGTSLLGSGDVSLPTVNDATINLTQGGVIKGSFTLNQASGATIALDSGGSVKTFDLFDHKWSDHQIDDQSWLRADTFSWQDGTVYTDAYNHLVDDIDGKTATSETVGSYTISYYLADDGHKITTDETNAANIYNESGVSWYYVLDTVNTRFKLPRTKYGFVGLRDAVGKYVEAGLPNITGQFSATDIYNAQHDYTGTGCFENNANGRAPYAGGGGNPDTYRLIDMDASRSSDVYGSSTTVQPQSQAVSRVF